MGVFRHFRLCMWGKHTVRPGDVCACGDSHLFSVYLLIHFRAKCPTSCDSPRFTSTSPWWSVSWSSAASMRSRPCSPMLTQTLWVTHPAAVSAGLMLRVFICCAERVALLWTMHGASFPHSHIQTEHSHGDSLSLFNLPGIFFCIFVLFFPESMPWGHRRLSLHHHILVVHEVGSHFTAPAAHTLCLCMMIDIRI